MYILPKSVPTDIKERAKRICATVAVIPTIHTVDDNEPLYLVRVRVKCLSRVSGVSDFISVYFVRMELAQIFLDTYKAPHTRLFWLKWLKANRKNTYETASRIVESGKKKS